MKRKAGSKAKKKTVVERRAEEGKMEPVVEEEIDPDEPRYCICQDVSFGTMIACENEEVCFHFPYLLSTILSLINHLSSLSSIPVPILDSLSRRSGLCLLT